MRHCTNSPQHGLNQNAPHFVSSSKSLRASFCFRHRRSASSTGITATTIKKQGEGYIWTYVRNGAHTYLNPNVFLSLSR